MAVEFLINRLKALIIFFLGIFKRALCCLKRRRKSSCDSIPLSAIGVIPNSAINNKQEQEQWDQWDDNTLTVVADKSSTNTIQSKIENYRQQIAKSPDSDEESKVNFFEDMIPKITKQKKILLRDSKGEKSSMNLAKFAVATERIPTNELEVWEENDGGWEKETIDEFGDPTQALREQKRREREQRLFEQHQKRIEYNYRPQPLGEKVIS